MEPKEPEFEGYVSQIKIYKTFGWNLQPLNWFSITIHLKDLTTDIKHSIHFMTSVNVVICVLSYDYADCIMLGLFPGGGFKTTTIYAL